MNLKPQSVLIGILALCLIAVAGCGSGGESQAAAPTRAEFIKQGSAICKRNQEEILSAVQKTEARISHGKRPPRAVQERILIKVVPPFLERRTKELAKLVAPAGEAKQVKAIVTGYEEGLEAIAANPPTVVTGKPLKPGTDAAKAYGLTKCS